MAFISRMLDSQPGIKLKKIRWQDAALATPPVPGERHIELEAELSPFDGNYRIGMERIANLMAQLRRETGVTEVVLTRSPVNTDSAAALTGNTRGGTASLQAAFALKLRYRESP